MDDIQKIRTEMRERLSQTLMLASALERENKEGDQELKIYELGKASAYRSVLAVIGEIE